MELQDASENDEEQIDADAIEDDIEEISGAESIENEAEENPKQKRNRDFQSSSCWTYKDQRQLCIWNRFDFQRIFSDR